MIQLPAQWEDWQIIRRLGSGSYSVVYEAQRKDDPAIRCAIKVIAIPQDDADWDEVGSDGVNAELSRSYYEEAVRECTHEIRLMEHFKGLQNIVSIEDFKVVPKEDGIGSYIFIRMELLTSLNHYLSDKTLTDVEIARLGIDICTALEFCGEKKIIHRDIKPENIFVNNRMTTRVFFKLGDFGIARNMENMTRGLSSRGTPNYMAPEVAASRSYDEKADIYSLGMTLYWLANGRRLPFFPQTQLYTPAMKREAWERRMSGEALPNPAYCSDALAEVILRACAFRPEDRYKNAAEMKEALNRTLNQQTAEPEKDAGEKARDPEAARQEKQEKQKNTGIRTRILSVAAAVVLALGAGAGYVNRDRLFSPEKQSSGAENRAESGETDAAKTMVAQETGTPEPETAAPTSAPTPDPALSNRITAVFKAFGKQESMTARWLKQNTSSQAVIPESWSVIPFTITLEQAPVGKATMTGQELELFFEDVQSHERMVKASTGGMEWACAWNPGTKSFRATLEEDILAEELQIQVSCREGDTEVVFTYEISAENADAAAGEENPETAEGTAEAVSAIKEADASANVSGISGAALLKCVSALTRLPLSDGKAEAETREDGQNQYRLQSSGYSIYASYSEGRLSRYDDRNTGCVYNAEGYVISGEVPEGYLSPVVLAEDGAYPREQRQRSMLKRLQAMKAGMTRVHAYAAAGHVYIPEQWEELPGSDISLQYAPKIGIKDDGTMKALDIPLDERDWKVDVSASTGVHQSGGMYDLSPSSDWEIHLSLDSEVTEEEGHTGVECQAVFVGNEKDGLTCTEVSYVYYERNLTMSWPGGGTRGGKLYYLQMRDQWDALNRTEWLDYLYTDQMHYGRMIVGSYVKAFGSKTAELTENAIVKEGEAVTWPRISIDRGWPCVYLPYEETLVPVERTMGEESQWIRSLADLQGESLDILGEYPLESCNNNGGDWTAVEVRNRSNAMLMIGEIQNPGEEDISYYCLPGVLQPGASGWIIVNDYQKERIWFVKGKTNQTGSLETEIRGDGSARMTNSSGKDLYSLDWLYFTKDEQGERESAYLNDREEEADYALPSGETMLLPIEEEGVERLYAWGYPKP